MEPTEEAGVGGDAVLAPADEGSVEEASGEAEADEGLTQEVVVAEHHDGRRSHSNHRRWDQHSFSIAIPYGDDGLDLGRDVKGYRGRR